MISGQSGIEPQLRKISSPTNQSSEHSFVIAIQILRRMTTQYFSFDIYIKLKGRPLFYVPVAARVLSYVFLHALSSLY